MALRLSYLYFLKPLFLLFQLSSNVNCGTFSPLLLVFKGATEKFAAIHNQWMIRLNDLLKEVVKYSEELQKKHKKIKEDESGTLEAAKLIQVRNNMTRPYKIHPQIRQA